MYPSITISFSLSSPPSSLIHISKVKYEEEKKKKKKGTPTHIYKTERKKKKKKKKKKKRTMAMSTIYKIINVINNLV